MKFTYLWVNLLSVIIPLLFSFHPRLKFYKEFKWFFPANFLMAAIFLTWDAYYTKLGVWGFNPDYLTGIYVFNLPIEEVLFFVCIPFACVYTYHMLLLSYKLEWPDKLEHIFILSMSSALLVIGIYYYDKAYTSVTFIGLAVFLLFLKYAVKWPWLSKITSTYGILILPFLIVNGVLTGTGLEAPIVWYDDAENLGLRILTIPVEDLFYGFLMILLNVFFYHWLKEKYAKAPQ